MDQEGSQMIRLTATAAMFFTLCSGSALAETQAWNITEVAVDGAQGQWYVTIDAANKLVGKTNMQFDTGSTLSYELEGSVSNGTYVVKLLDRNDGKKGCVSSGNISLNPDKKSHKVLGDVQCDGDEKFYIRGGY
jgi:hypothetical protein